MHYGVFYQAMNTEYWCRKLVFPQPARVSAEPPADLTKTAQGFYFQELHASLQNSSACHTHITSHFHPPSNVWQGGEWLITPESQEQYLREMSCFAADVELQVPDIVPRGGRLPLRVKVKKEDLDVTTTRVIIYNVVKTDRPFAQVELVAGDDGWYQADFKGSLPVGTYRVTVEGLREFHAVAPTDLFVVV